MTSAPTSTRKPAAPAEGRIGRSGRARPKRGEGQWALGYNEPLNKNEQSKKDDNPLNVRARIINIYSKRGFASIDPADLRGRFRWMGLYTQRAPGFDGGKTAMLEEEELDDEFFMMRVRSDGALLSHEAVRALGTIGVDFARDTADVTDRENIQYHWIRIEDVPAIWERLEAAGLDTMEACGDSPRPFLGSPVAGVSLEEIIDGTAALEEIKRRFIEDCKQDEATARQQAVRGTFDPGYFAYTLGKLQILELRAEAQRALGERFELRKFHDALLSHGAPPIPLIRAQVLADLGVR